mmetsp:Transcript_15976/g.40755  ORF Transcript_15976/g.40755 Transcript_15976/m.40755 type:complete len:324 (+) Transcript_15976:221-1192(+)
MMGSDSLLCCREDSESLDNISGSQSDSEMPDCMMHIELGELGDFDLTHEETTHVLREIRRQERDFMPDCCQLRRLSSEILQQRISLVSSIECVCQRMQFHSSTFFAAVNIVDRFLSTYSVKHSDKWVLPLIGIASVSIAAKMGEVFVPSLGELRECMAPILPFDLSHVQKMEIGILNILCWKMACITPYTVLPYLLRSVCPGSSGKGRVYSMAGSSSEMIKLVHSTSIRSIKNLMHAGLQYTEFTPTEIAWACMLHTLEKLECEDWQAMLSEGCGGPSRSAVRKCMKEVEKLSDQIDAFGEYQHKRERGRSLSPLSTLDSRFV